MKLKLKIKIKIENNNRYYKNKADINMKLYILCPYTVDTHHYITIDDVTEKTKIKELIEKIDTIFKREKWLYHPKKFMKLRRPSGTKLIDMEMTLGDYSMINNLGEYKLILTMR